MKKKIHFLNSGPEKAFNNLQPLPPFKDKIETVKVLRQLASALTWYYTVSNTITLLLQFVIQTYIIDHAKILAKMKETRTKPKAKSKWQERYAQVMETQKKVESMKSKTGGK